MGDEETIATPIVVAGNPQEAETFARQLARAAAALDHTVDKLDADRTVDASEGKASVTLNRRLRNHASGTERLSTPLATVTRAVFDFADQLRNLQAQAQDLETVRARLVDTASTGVRDRPNEAHLQDSVLALREQEVSVHKSLRDALAAIPSAWDLIPSVGSPYGPTHPDLPDLSP